MDVDQVKQLEHEVKSLAEVLGKILVAAGGIENVPLSGPQLLQFGQELVDQMSLGAGLKSVLEMKNVNWLSNVIRAADGENKLGAGALAEVICEAVEQQAAARRLAASKIDESAECAVRLDGGLSLRCPAAPAECEYIRVVDGDGEEIGYWDHQEFEVHAADVLGALMGLMSEAQG